MTAYLHHLAYDFRTGLRDKSLMLMYYLFPLVFYVMMGLLMTNINPEFKKTIIPAMIANTLMASCLLSLPSGIVESRLSGIYRSFRINGVPAINILTVPVNSIIAHAVIASAIITLTAIPFFDATAPNRILPFIGLILLSGFAMAGLGLLIGVVSANNRASVLIAQAIYIPSMMLGGLMLPTSMLPASLHRVAYILPATHIMNAFNGSAMGLPTDFDPLISIAILLAGGLVAFGLSVFLFNWDPKLSDRRRPKLLALLALLPYLVGVLLAI